ncbi:CST complex subunit Ten1 [Pyronema domesticum]|nr:CST complex subunit Ten1 [Pyronema domesticum]
MSLVTPLHDLASQPSGQKVRFLSCLFSYDIPTSTLILHQFPDLARFVKVNATATVGTLNMGSLAKGGWWNVVGYIEENNNPDQGDKVHGDKATKGDGNSQDRASFSREAKEDKTNGEVIARVRAIMVWPAEGMNVAKYNRTIEEMREVQKEMDMAMSLNLGNVSQS